MNSDKLDYLKSLKPAPHRDGREVLKEGIEIGNSFQSGTSRFIRESGHKSFLEYKKQLARDGKIYFNFLLGLASLEEQIDGIEKTYEFMQRTGLRIDGIQGIASQLSGLPKKYRDKAPKPTSFIMDSPEDYLAQSEAVPIEQLYVDYVLSSPAALDTTINSLKAGGAIIGDFAQIIWGFPGFDDELGRSEDVVKSLGIMAAKSHEDRAVFSYIDDGFPGYAMDCVTYIGYALIEQYICSKLCNTKYVLGFGGLISDNDLRAATAMAFDKVLSTPEHQVLMYVNGSTNLQWDHDTHGNYGISIPETLFSMLVERKYRIGLGVNPVSITEKIAVPTLQELFDIVSADKRVEEKLAEWDKFFDFSILEQMRDSMAEQGMIFFDNALSGFKDAGFDIEDPLEMIQVLVNFNPIQFEQMFHPSTFNSLGNKVEAYFPTVLGRQTIILKDNIVNELKAANLENALEGVRIVVASGDWHTYGLILVDGVLNDMGAKSILGGVDMDAADLLDLADEEGVNLVGVSCHIGQSLDYAKQLVQLSQMRGKEYFIFMGGVLNAILPGHSVPSDVTDKINAMGIFANNDLKKLIEILKTKKG